MKEIFLASLTPMLSLFLFMAIGFILVKTKVLPENASKVMAKLLTFVFSPALSFYSMSKNFNVQSIGEYASLFILGSIMVILAIIVATIIARFFVKDKEAYERGIYKYALALGNYGYMGAPLVIALFGLEGYTHFSFVTLPCYIVIYTWGINALIPKNHQKRSFLTSLKGFFNVPTIGLFLGMLVGITGLGSVMHSSTAVTFLTDCISDLGDCMAPVAMLLAGVTVAKYDIKKMVGNKKVYYATALRLIFIPALLIAVMFGIMSIARVLGVTLDNSFLFLAFFVYATPLGMNTIVFPEAFGGDPSIGAGLTLVSHIICVITIPIMFALLGVLFGPIPIF